MCDRKFYIDDLFSEFRTVLSNIENEEKVMKGQIQIKEIEINRIDSEITKLQENKESMSVL